MATERSLLNRLERPASTSSRKIGASSAEVSGDVRRNLQVLLNSTHGSSWTVPDYGVADLTDVSRAEAPARRIAAEIRKTVERYEPRLSQVEVKSSQSDPSDPLTLQFRIHGCIAADDDPLPVVFRSRIETSGEILVEVE